MGKYSHLISKNTPAEPEFKPPQKEVGGAPQQNRWILGAPPRYPGTRPPRFTSNDLDRLEGELTRAGPAAARWMEWVPDCIYLDYGWSDLDCRYHAMADYVLMQHVRPNEAVREPKDEIPNPNPEPVPEMATEAAQGQQDELPGMKRDKCR